MATKPTRSGRQYNRQHGGRRLKGAARDDSPNNLLARDRESQVVELRRAGFTYDAIARRVGYANRGAANKAFTRAMEERREQTAESAADLMAIQLERYETIIAQLWPFAQVRPGNGLRPNQPGYIGPSAPDPKIVARLLQAMAQKETLLGMQQPRGRQAPEDATEIARKIRLALGEMDAKMPGKAPTLDKKPKEK